MSKFTLLEMTRATGRASSYRDEYVRRAKRMDEDCMAESRRKARRCAWCFYMPSIGGAAMTHSRCESCDVETLYSSTNTDRLCGECADKFGACAHCGADRELKGCMKLERGK